MRRGWGGGRRELLRGTPVGESGKEPEPEAKEGAGAGGSVFPDEYSDSMDVGTMELVMVWVGLN
jgi:hypothetical protein